MSVDSRLAHHGHVSYLEIPAADVEQSAAFYEAVFSWRVDRRGDGRASFDDGTGTVIGRWVGGATPSREAGIVPYIYVDRLDDVIQRIAIYGGNLVKPPYAEGDLWVATFRDPAGNLLGAWQAGPR
ncbi:MAG TPA: VOC family protein [Tepidisphaeraceae bacterium]|jgi:hypothetical protein